MNFDFIETFPPLGNPEHHFNKYPEHPWLKTRKDIEGWLLRNMMIVKEDQSITNKDLLEGNVVIHDDLTVSAKNNYLGMQYRVGSLCKIPIQVRECEELKLSGLYLSSAIGSPYMCDYLDLSINEIENWVGISKNIKKSINLYNNRIESLNGMPEFKYEIGLDLDENEIDSLDGLSNNVKELILNDSGVLSDEEIVKLIMEAPDTLRKYTINEIRDLNNNLMKNEVVDLDEVRKIKKIKKEMLEIKAKMEEISSCNLPKRRKI